jgi:hypothetical protein
VNRVLAPPQGNHSTNIEAGDDDGTSAQLFCRIQDDFGNDRFLR